jgi:hypothetical protein
MEKDNEYSLNVWYEEEGELRTSTPCSRLWHACIHRALVDLWSSDPELSRGARLWIEDNDQTYVNSFDNTLHSLGYDPEELRKMLLRPKDRKRIRRMFKRQGYRSDLLGRQKKF